MLLAHGYMYDGNAPIPPGATFHESGTVYRTTRRLEAGLFFMHEDELGYKLELPLVLLQGET